MKQWLNQIYQHLFALFFPDHCAVCRERGNLLCGNCRATLQAYPKMAAPTDLVSIQVGWIYDEPARRAIHCLKYRGRRRMGGVLAEALATTLTPPEADALIPVPLHPERLSERGFNQAEELANSLGLCWGIPVCSRGLERERDTGHQARLNREARQGNVAGAFFWHGPGRPPARIILIDDVVTTGATLSACAEALLAAGAEQVHAIALARSLVRGSSGSAVRRHLAQRRRRQA